MNEKCNYYYFLQKHVGVNKKNITHIFNIIDDNFYTNITKCNVNCYGVKGYYFIHFLPHKSHYIVPFYYIQTLFKKLYE